jgi:type II secretory pathway pseudopilin PulG
MRQPVRTLLSLLSIAIPIGLVAAIAAPNVRTARNRSRQKQTMADMRSLATAMEARATNTNKYDLGRFTGPVSAGDAREFGTLHRVSYADLSRALAPAYIRTLPRFDGWGTELDVRVNGDQSLYALRSAGSDRSFELRPYTPGAVRDFESDIVFSNGNFLQYPEGSCSQ